MEVRTGEVVGITLRRDTPRSGGQVGRNPDPGVGAGGMGKSTLLKILSRITSPTTGSITDHARAGLRPRPS